MIDFSRQLDINKEDELKPVGSLIETCSRMVKMSKISMFKITGGLTLLFVLADVCLGIYDIVLHSNEDKDCNRQTEDRVVTYATIGNAGMLLFFGMVSFRYANRLMADSYGELSFFRSNAEVYNSSHSISESKSFTGPFFSPRTSIDSKRITEEKEEYGENICEDNKLNIPYQSIPDVTNFSTASRASTTSTSNTSQNQQNFF